MNTLQIVESESNARVTTNTGVVVSVIAWKAGSGIGFEWYYSAAAADRIMQFRRERDAEYISDIPSLMVRTVHVRIDVEVSSFDAADQEINARLEDLLEQASAEALH